MNTLPHSNLVLFDGVCNLCNGFVLFLIKQDRHNILSFTSLQSDLGKELSTTDESPGFSVVYIRNERQYRKSDAVLRIFQDLGGIWKLTGIFFLIPKFLRNGIYNWVAQNRYRFGKKRNNCMLPNSDLKSKILG